MDNKDMQEQKVGSSPQEKTSVPSKSDWIFPGGQQFKDVQILPGEMLLSEVNKNRIPTEYLHDTRSKIKAEKETKISANYGSTDIDLFFKANKVNMSYAVTNLYDVDNEKNSLSVLFHVGEDPKDIAIFAEVNYYAGQLNFITFSSIFKATEDMKEDFSAITLKKNEDASGSDPGDWEVGWKIRSKDKKRIDHKKPGEASFIDESTDLNYKVRWEVQEGKLIVTQERTGLEIESSDAKKITAPLEFDVAKLRNSVTSSRIGRNGKMNSQWLNVPQIVGVRYDDSRAPKTVV